MGSILEESGEGRVAHETTLVDGRQDGELIEEGFAKSSTVIHVDGG